MEISFFQPLLEKKIICDHEKRDKTIIFNTKKEGKQGGDLGRGRGVEGGWVYSRHFRRVLLYHSLRKKKIVTVKRYKPNDVSYEKKVSPSLSLSEKENIRRRKGQNRFCQHFRSSFSITLWERENYKGEKRDKKYH